MTGAGLRPDPKQVFWILRVRTAIAALALFGLFVGRFWWPGETTAWAGFIRSCLFIGLILALPCWRYLVDQVRSNRYAWCLLGFLVYALLSSLLLGDGKVGRRILLLFALFTSVCVIEGQGRNYIRTLLAVMVVVSAVAALITLYYYWEAGHLFKGYRMYAIADSGVAGLAAFENSVLASLEMAFSLVVAFWLILTIRSTPARLAMLCCCVPIVVYLFSTFGRSGWLAAGVAIVALILVISKPVSRRRIVIAGGAGAALILAIFHQFVAYELFQRSLSGRDEIWAMVIGLMPGHWLVGHGADISIEDLLGVQKLLGADAVINHSHSIYVEVLFNYGIIGLVAFTTVIIGTLYVLWRSRRDALNQLWFAILAGTVVVMAVDFNSFISTPNLLWLWLWLPIGWALALSMRQDGRGKSAGRHSVC